MLTIPESLRQRVTTAIEADHHAEILGLWAHTLELELHQAYYVARRLVCAGYGTHRKAAHGNNSKRHTEVERALLRLYQEHFLNVIDSSKWDETTLAEFRALTTGKPRW